MLKIVNLISNWYFIYVIIDELFINIKIYQKIFSFNVNNDKITFNTLNNKFDKKIIK